MPTFSDRLKHGWNAFFNNRDPTNDYVPTIGVSDYTRPDRIRLTPGNEKSIVNAVINRIANDAAAVNIRHIKVDANERFSSYVNDGLDNILVLDANIDQTGRAFRKDAIMSMFDEGCVALVPIDTTIDPKKSSSYDILTARTGKILQWYPEHVQVRVYNERTGKKEDIILPKKLVCIVENPFYSVMNEPNSIMKRLTRKLNLLDAIDEQSGAGKLDLIIQLPYVIKSETRKKQAEDRKKDIEAQLAGSKYGIAYIDGTEHITQLNRSVDNNLMSQIEYLTEMFYSQLGITKEIMNGTADEKTMLNYNNRTIEPILSAFTDAMTRTWITKTARSQGHRVMFFQDPFRLVPINNIADIADKFTRNEILSSNEVRGLIGFKPVDSKEADELRNKNLNKSTEELEEGPTTTVEREDDASDAMNTQINE